MTRQLEPDIDRELARPAVVRPFAIDQIVSNLTPDPTPRSSALQRRSRLRWTIIGFSAVAAGVLGAAILRLPSITSSPRLPTSRNSSRTVAFVFVAHSAKRVSLVGDFNDWNPASLPMQQTSAPGVWSLVVPLHRGRHVYSFVVDDTTWLPDPSAPTAPENEFGTRNSVAFVGDEG